MRLLTAALTALLLAAQAVAVSPQTMTPVTNRPAAPDFALTDLDGKPHRLSAYRGKIVLLNFWATWCPPCRKELPSMQRAYEKLRGERFAMLAVDVGEDEETVLPFTLSTGVELTFPILFDKSGETIKAWPVKGLPTTFVIDPEGRIVYRAVGGREWDDPKLLETIRSLFKD
jgi:peroxiredoxin